MQKLTSYQTQYLETALWSTVGLTQDCDASPSLDDVLDVSGLMRHFPQWCEASLKDLENFLETATETGQIDLKDWEDAAHNFWLSREGHGAGFFDSDYMAGRELQAASKVYGAGELHVFVTLDDDGQVTCFFDEAGELQTV